MLKVRYLPIGIALVNSRSKKGGNNSNLYGYFIGTVSIMKSAEIYLISILKNSMKIYQNLKKQAFESDLYGIIFPKSTLFCTGK